MASIYKRGKFWWIAYYANGKQHRRPLRTQNKHVAMREKQALESEFLSSGRLATEPVDPDVEEFWKEYSAWANAHKRPRSIERTALSWKHLLSFAHPSRLGDISRQTIEDFKRARLAAGVKPQTVNNELRDLQAIFSRAIKQQWFTGQNPVLGVERFHIPRTMPEFHTEEQLLTLLDCAKRRSRTAEWVVLLTGWAGLRRAEVVNCRWEWFDFSHDSPVIRVQRSDTFELKDKEDRAIPMSRRIWDSFWPHRQSEGYVFEQAVWSEGRHHYRFDPKKSLIASLKDAKLPTERPFQRLRHTFGSLHAQKGKSLFSISKWMGHSSVQVTERHYAGLQAYDPEIDSF